MLATVLDIAVVSAMASLGILMAPISTALIAGLFVIALAYLALLDLVKVWMFRHIGLQ